MYIRFQGQQPNLGTASKLGIFQLTIQLRDADTTPLYVSNEIERNLSWLRQHLKSPAILKKGESFRAISWFKPAAKEPLKRIWSLKAILEDHGYRIDLLKEKDIGQIIYEDGWQAIARP